MKNVFFRGQYVRIAPLTEAKKLHLSGNLPEVSHSSEDWVRIVSLRSKSDVKVQLIYLIYPKQKTEKLNK